MTDASHASRGDTDALREERQRELRAAFEAGTRWQHHYVEEKRKAQSSYLNGWAGWEVEREAKARYPIKQRIARGLEFESASVTVDENGHLKVSIMDRLEAPFEFTLDPDKLNDLLVKPYAEFDL